MEEAFAGLTLKEKKLKPKPKVTEKTSKKPRVARKLDFEEDTTQYQIITLTAGDCVIRIKK